MLSVLPVLTINVIIDGPCHEYRDHRPESLALSVEVISCYGVKFALVCVPFQLLWECRNTQ